MDVFYSDYSTGCKNIWIRLLCIKMTVFGNRFNKRFLIDVLSSWLTAVHSYCCIKRFLETLFNSFFRNCLVHVVTYYNITHKDKLKGQLRIISIRTSLSKGYWPKTDQFVNFNFINFIVRLYHFIVRFKLSSCQNWEIISNRNIVVL